MVRLALSLLQRDTHACISWALLPRPFFDFPRRVLRQFGFLQDMPDLTAPDFAPRPLTGRVAGRIVEAWIGRTSLETESLPRYDDPEATGSVTGVPEQQDDQEKDQ